MHTAELQDESGVYSVSAVELLPVLSRHERLLRSGVLLWRRTLKDEPELHLQTKDHRHARTDSFKLGQTAQNTLTISLIQSFPPLPLMMKLWKPVSATEYIMQLIFHNFEKKKINNCDIN